ncbi:hypothetical protein HDA40_007906 [Hamadaea flava]|nr:hypothetical protein [Hamadaea flava]
MLAFSNDLVVVKVVHKIASATEVGQVRAWQPTVKV